MAEPLALVFRRPFREQIAAFRLRLGNLVPTARWDDISGNEHDRAFMVAGAVKADLLADLALAVDKAISKGTTLDEFRRDFRATVTKHGWHGWTGEGTKAGEAWRTRVIYRTNAATSYAAGRLAQLVEGKFAFWVYRHGGSREPRLHHLAWDGLVLPSDHAFWETHFAPNGWGCSCYIIGARTERGAKRVGGDPGKNLAPGWDTPDPRTGTPPGVGKGWDHAPGGSVTDTVLTLRDKLDDLPEQLSVALIQDWLNAGLFSKWLADPVGSWPLVRIPLEDARALGAKRTVADLSADTARKQLQRHPELRIADYANAQKVIQNATHRIQDTPRSLIYVLATDDGYVLVVKATRSGDGLFVTSFRRLSGDEARRDRTVRQLVGKA